MPKQYPDGWETDDALLDRVIDKCQRRYDEAAVSAQSAYKKMQERGKPKDSEIEGEMPSMRGTRGMEWNALPTIEVEAEGHAWWSALTMLQGVRQKRVMRGRAAVLAVAVRLMQGHQKAAYSTSPVSNLIQNSTAFARIEVAYELLKALEYAGLSIEDKTVGELMSQSNN